jgi:hypothetical protein
MDSPPASSSRPRGLSRSRVLVVALAKEEPISGLQEMRRGALMAYEKETLQDRMKIYFDPEVDWNTFAAL